MYNDMCNDFSMKVFFRKLTHYFKVIEIKGPVRKI